MSSASSHPYDYLVVGAGLFGSVWAREATDAGRRCLVLERRPHTGGNAFTEHIEGIVVHRYGAHVFHTDNERIWSYVRRFAEFDRYVHRVRVEYRGRHYSFPINLRTLGQLYGVATPEQARDALEAARIPHADPQNLEEWVLDRVGWELYEIFIRGYTWKQWQRDPRELPCSIIQRIPIRLTDDDRYFSDRYQGLPQGGYTPLMQNLLAGIETRTGVDYLADKGHWDAQARWIVFTGCIDEYFGRCEGALEYRTIDFTTKVLEGDFQGTAVVNHTAPEVAHTRTTEHKYLAATLASPIAAKRVTSPTVVTWETPAEWRPGKEPLYPIGDAHNRELHRRYLERAAAETRVVFGGRLAEYRYYDMHQVIGAAHAKVHRHLARTS